MTRNGYLVPRITDRTGGSSTVAFSAALRRFVLYLLVVLAIGNAGQFGCCEIAGRAKKAGR